MVMLGELWCMVSHTGYDPSSFWPSFTLTGSNNLVGYRGILGVRALAHIISLSSTRSIVFVFHLHISCLIEGAYNYWSEVTLASRSRWPTVRPS
jgi:hypothetical protein